VALLDALPAGFEVLNPALALGETAPRDEPARNRVRWWNPFWFEHQNLRDERVEVFSSLLWEGVCGYTYCARATTPGTFVVPPTKAEEMYHPETFGRAASDRVSVETPRSRDAQSLSYLPGFCPAVCGQRGGAAPSSTKRKRRDPHL